MPDTIPAPSPVGKRPARAWRIVLGAVLLLGAMANSANIKTAPGDLAGALGALTGTIIMVALAVWLIATGLPKSLGGEELKRLRLRIWSIGSRAGELRTARPWPCFVWPRGIPGPWWRLFMAESLVLFVSFVGFVVG